MTELEQYLMTLPPDTKVSSDPTIMKFLAPALPAQQPRRKTFGFGEQKPVDTRTFQQYDPSNPVAQKQIGSSPVGVVLPNNPYREEAKEAVLKNVAQAMTDPMMGVTKLPTPPKATQKAYKLFRRAPDDPESLYPLYVNANDPVRLGEWYAAEAGPITERGKVKSKLGELAYRPGWHAGDAPMAAHIGGGGAPPKYRQADQVWAEVEMPADVDWQKIATERGYNEAGQFSPVRAHITDQIPEGGFYRYKTNPNMTGEWLIGGGMKVNRVLSDAEVAELNRLAGVADLPRRTVPGAVLEVYEKAGAKQRRSLEKNWPELKFLKWGNKGD